jgi:hypothetical protein
MIIYTNIHIYMHMYKKKKSITKNPQFVEKKNPIKKYEFANNILVEVNIISIIVQIHN